MKRHRWTEQDDAEIRRRINLEQTYVEIGAFFGVSRNAIAGRVQRLGLGSHERSAFIRTRRFKGKKRPAGVMARIVAASKARAQDSEYRAKLQQVGARNAHNPKRLAACRRAMDRKRGGPLTPDIAEKARFYREVKKCPAREAYALALAERSPSTAIAIADKGARP